MVRNIFLGGLLVALLVFTYFFEERSQQKKILKDYAETSLFSLQQLKGEDLLEFAVGTFTFIPQKNKLGEFIFKKKNISQPLNQKLLQFILNEISLLKIKRVITQAEIKQKQLVREKFFFPLNAGYHFSFLFPNRRIEVEVGKKLPLQDSFYMEIKTTNLI